MNRQNTCVQGAFTLVRDDSKPDKQGIPDDSEYFREERSRDEKERRASLRRYHLSKAFEGEQRMRPVASWGRPA